MSGTNWWKVAFFVLLIAAELMREEIVVGLDSEVRLVSQKSIYSTGYSFHASGVWARADGGDRLALKQLRIDCYKDREECDVASVPVNGIGILPIQLERERASFEGSTVSFGSVNECFTLVTRIDVEAQTAFQTRNKNADWRTALSDDEMLLTACEAMEDSITARLTGGLDPIFDEDRLEGHFVPLLQIMSAL